MRVAIVGGKLQGFEAAYLAKKAGWEILLVDKKPEVPAAVVCDQFYLLDVTKILEWMPILKGVDLIIPALENQETLASLVRSARFTGTPLLFDKDAYAISSSKIDSNRLFAEIGIPAPVPWPECGFPIIVKPSGASGSEGVYKINDPQEFAESFANGLQDWVLEEYLDGPSYSLEVIGFSGVYKVLQITELDMDKSFDCKRVVCSALLPEKLRAEFELVALKLARSLNLEGIMDVETILHQGKLKVLEIDARLPSQTPIAVYHATGVNMLEVIGNSFMVGGPWQEFNVFVKSGVVFEHIHISDDRLEICGEHIMADAGPLYLYPDFYGADEAISNYIPGKTDWVATLIITGSTSQDAWLKRRTVIQNIKKEWGIREYVD